MVDDPASARIGLRGSDLVAGLVDLRGAAAKSVQGRVLTTPAMNTLNSFEQLDTVRPAAFDGATITQGGLTAKLPARSVTVLEIR